MFKLIKITAVSLLISISFSVQAETSELNEKEVLGNKITALINSGELHLAKFITENDAEIKDIVSGMASIGKNNLDDISKKINSLNLGSESESNGGVVGALTELLLKKTDVDKKDLVSIFSSDLKLEKFMESVIRSNIEREDKITKDEIGFIDNRPVDSSKVEEIKTTDTISL